jgi:hypothetical protein
MHKGSRLSRSFGTIGTTPAKCLLYFHPSDQSLVFETAQPSSFNKSAAWCQAPAARLAVLLASGSELTRVCPQFKSGFDGIDGSPKFGARQARCQAPAARPAVLLACSHELPRVCPHCKSGFDGIDRSLRFGARHPLLGQQFC